MPELMRHIDACRNVTLPGPYRRLVLEGEPAGWVLPEAAAALRAHGAADTADGVAADWPALRGAGAALAAAGRHRVRGEAFDLRSDRDGRVLGQIDRGALPSFGIRATGVHVNGLVRRPDGWHVWVGRRAADKQLDPGKLDHVVAGGVPAGLTPRETLIKEAAEEAGMPAELAAQAVEVGEIAYATRRPEGLRRDRLYCYDLVLPEDFVPKPVDGEVAGFERWKLSRALDAVRDTDDFKFNVTLVLIDACLRHGLLDPESKEGRALRTALSAPQS